MTTTPLTRCRICSGLLLVSLTLVGCGQSVNTTAPLSAVEQSELQEQLLMIERQTQGRLPAQR